MNAQEQEQKNQGMDLKSILANLSEDQKKALKNELKKTRTSENTEILINTARNHRAKLQNNLFDLKEMGCPQEILDELMTPLEFKQCKTKTQARLKKEAELAKTLEHSISEEEKVEESKPEEVKVEEKPSRKQGKK